MQTVRWKLLTLGIFKDSKTDLGGVAGASFFFFFFSEVVLWQIINLFFGLELRIRLPHLISILEII